jgi:7,8-dihydropterin-6-yl-methyl-4-(beta-D-ribofuranosyl)aminobenzene 5'-phosphate synthase
MQRGISLLRAAALPVGAVLATFSALTLRYALQGNRVEASWLAQTASKLRSVGEVAHLSVLPIVERLTSSHEHCGEPGVSYLLKADRAILLFDAGLNAGGKTRSALVHNAELLGADLQTLDGVVISHLHGDHVGGFRTALRRSFAFSAEPLEPRGLPAYVPTEMHHDRADVVITTEPRVIAEGVALLPPLPAMMFWLGPVAEQVLVVNVREFGLVLISGCGHPGIERMLRATELVLDVPIRAVIGGLHLPVHPFGTPLLIQGTLGNPNWPWQPVSESDAEAAIREVRARGPRFVALSGHDSTPWACAAFEHAFGGNYRTLHVGDQIDISAAGVVCSGRK